MPDHDCSRSEFVRTSVHFLLDFRFVRTNCEERNFPICGRYKKGILKPVYTAASLLFVPGSRPDRFPKAKAAGAGLTVIDLEDAVAAEDKESARAAALVHVAEGPEGWGNRINAVTTLAGVRDLAALGDADVLPSVLMVPMVETAAELDVIAGVLGDRCPDLVPLVETPKGCATLWRLSATREFRR